MENLSRFRSLRCRLVCDKGREFAQGLKWWPDSNMTHPHIFVLDFPIGSFNYERLTWMAILTILVFGLGTAVLLLTSWCTLMRLETQLCFRQLERYLMKVCTMDPHLRAWNLIPLVPFFKVWRLHHYERNYRTFVSRSSIDSNQNNSRWFIPWQFSKPCVWKIEMRSLL